MPVLGLLLLFLYGLLAIGLRIAVQFRRTGSTGLGSRPQTGTVEWASGLVLVTAVALCFGGTVLQIMNVLGPLAPRGGGLSGTLGATLAYLGIVSASLAQFRMGDAWRIGVDPTASTYLVSDGIFAIVRNPIFAAMLPAFIGFALLAPQPRNHRSSNLFNPWA